MASPNVPQSVKDMMNISQAPTAPLDDFLAIYREDDNIWWMMSSGHHLNLFDMAMDRVEELEKLMVEMQKKNDDLNFGYLKRESHEQEARQQVQVREGNDPATH